MTDQTPPPYPPPDPPSDPSGQPPPAPLPPPPPYESQPAPAGGYSAALGQPASVGQIRGTGFAILISIVTLGIYALYWYYKVHEEMKAHSGQGLGGGVALILAFFVGIVMPYITSSEVGGLYTRRGQPAPVSGVTGLWYFPGIFIIVGPIIWFVKTNGALNDYWRSLGAVG
jgi:hypothetical protein